MRRLWLVIVAGEVVFMLPFMIPRLFRPLMVEQWNITHTQIGTAFAAYGVVAMVSYLLGGGLADRFHPRSLIAASLALTGAGGLLLLAKPSAAMLVVAYSFFGFSTIFMLWGAMIKATHMSVESEQRSTAMGILDGGRGLAAAIVSASLVSVGSGVSNLNAAILSVTILCWAVAGAVWWGLRELDGHDAVSARWDWQHAVEILKDKKVWCLGIIILCAYSAYKSIDQFSVFLVEAAGQNPDQAAALTARFFWLRPLAAVAAGVAADRFFRFHANARFYVLGILLAAGGVSQWVLSREGANSTLTPIVLMASIAVCAYAVRAIYFSVLSDLKIPDHWVGTTVGLISFVGFLPDVFYGYVTGFLLDRNPGVLGLTHSFQFTAVLMGMGAVGSFYLAKINR